ncbi:hypothetical protein ACGFNU_32770 [Spirillospora sp. NPDC048911]|uniref:hypothetical protein n=1 Tax=Spirillospora sp. NPDC048911 TaxID=3364527 RepID=UPI0037114A9C
MAAEEGPNEGPRTEHTETADLYEHLIDLRRALRAGQELPAGRLLGLPDLPEGDVWVDAAGAAALADVEPTTVRSWLTRGRPKGNPFPAPIRILYRTYWPRSQIEAWKAAERGPHT